MANYKRKHPRDRQKMLACGCCYAYYNHKEPIEDGPCTGKVRSKRKRKPKERCPVNGQHEWYRETVVTEKFYDWFWSTLYQGTRVEKTYRLSTCIHCWKEKEDRIRYTRKREPRKDVMHMRTLSQT